MAAIPPALAAAAGTVHPAVVAAEPGKERIWFLPTRTAARDRGTTVVPPPPAAAVPTVASIAENIARRARTAAIAAAPALGFRFPWAASASGVDPSAPDRP